MAQTKEIKKKIGSVQNTKKITSAMELVASSKMKKTQDAMKKGKPYSQKIIELIDSLAGASSEYKHPFFKTTKQKTDIYIICLLYTSPSPRDSRVSRMPSSA